MEHHCAWCVMRVCAVDKNVLGWNAGGALDLFDHGIEMIAGDHENIIGDNDEFGSVLFEHDRCCAQLTLLSSRFSCGDTACDDHGIVCFQIHRSSADAKTRSCAQGQGEEKQNDCKFHRRMIH